MPVFRVIIVKSAEWRNTQEEFSNGYYFNGTKPSNRSEAEAFFMALWNVEKEFSNQLITLAQGYYYEDPTVDKPHVTIGRDYRGENIQYGSGGIASSSGGQQTSLEQCGLMKARCGYMKNGRVRYVNKYYHGVSAKQSDADAANWVASATLATKLAKFTDGTLPGGAKLCRPDGLVCETPQVSPWITTRTLKRRGKRPVKQG